MSHELRIGDKVVALPHAGYLYTNESAGEMEVVDVGAEYVRLKMRNGKTHIANNPKGRFRVVGGRPYTPLIMAGVLAILLWRKK